MRRQRRGDINRAALGMGQDETTREQMQLLLDL